LKAFLKLEQSIGFINQHFTHNEDSHEVGQLNSIESEMIKEGLIQRFEYTHELAWNVMKDYAEYQGKSDIGGSLDATREAFKLKLISNGDAWMDMIASRNKTSHTYNDQIADDIYNKILSWYYQEFLEFKQIMEGKYSAIRKL